jgi:CcmD family protein
MQATPPASQPASPPPAAQDEFVPISQLPPDEHVPAVPLLITAYAVVWIVVAVYLWTLWTRFRRAERDLEALARRLPKPQ